MRQKLLTGAVLLFSMLLLTAEGFAASKGWCSSVAVVVDRTTYEKAKGEVDAYVKSMEIKNGKGQLERTGILVIDKWGQPDSIKNCLYDLYKNKNLEGAVFVGDIPVPMIRDAHHLTTAFKMSPKRDWKESSVPSDRFYDDFDLKFDYLKQDGDMKLYHYYSLRADSPQEIHCDIYSARIKPPRVPGKDKYTLIAGFLKKAVQAKKESREMSKVLHFAGHGYNSESMNARIDEASALYEQFPSLKEKRGKDLEYMDFTFDTFIKNRLLAALSDRNLDLAILHHHGSDDTQLLNGSPNRSDAASWLDMSRNFFRSKIRNAKDTAKTIEYYVKEYDIPRHWVADTFDPRVIEQDSIYSASMDLHIQDMYGYVSGARVVILDACFNGSFHLDDYISAYHIFNPGGTIAVKANSVNTLQDTWTNELMGLLNYGVCVGNWTKGQMTLESHIIGDPTFAFTPEKNTLTAVKGFDLNRDITKERSNTAYWRKLLTAPGADIKSLAIKMLYNNQAIAPAELLGILRNDPSCIVRMEAFMRLKQQAGRELVDAILLGMNDSYELLQRLSCMTAAKCGDPRLVPDVARIYLSPVSTARINFQNKYTMDICDADLLTGELKKQRTEQTGTKWPGENVFAARLKAIKSLDAAKKKEFNALKDSSTPVKERTFTVSGQRNGCDARALDGLFYLLSPESHVDDAVKVNVAEVLGWYRYSYKKEEILQKCNELYTKEKSPVVKNELLKTINRLK